MPSTCVMITKKCPEVVHACTKCGIWLPCTMSFSQKSKNKKIIFKFISPISNSSLFLLVSIPHVIWITSSSSSCRSPRPISKADPPLSDPAAVRKHPSSHFSSLACNHRSPPKTRRQADASFSLLLLQHHRQSLFFLLPSTCVAFLSSPSSSGARNEVVNLGCMEKMGDKLRCLSMAKQKHFRSTKCCRIP